MIRVQDIIENSINLFEEVADNYSNYEELIAANNLIKLNEFADDFQVTINEMQQEKRKLRLGVVGQVKAGKSTFLNALLFEGKNLLPKAATPMTAALTVITYGNKPKAKVEFYSRNDWEKIEERADKYQEIIAEEKSKLGLTDLSDEEVEGMVDIPAELKASNQLVKQARKSGVNINNYFDGEEIIPATSIDDLLGKMDDYVGVDGKYTPLVKSSKLYIDHQGLKGLEVIDTPGMNDPIVSRGRKTRKFLKKCDAVFMLSYAGQFMDNSDVRLITNNLPNEGIKEVLLLGSKFDSALLGEAGKHEYYEATKAHVKSALNDYAETVIKPKLNEQGNQEVFKALHNSLPPTFISGLAYNMAVNPEALGEDEEWVLNRLKKMFPEINFTRDFLLELANIEGIRKEELPRIRNNKEEIMQDKFQNYIRGQQSYFQDLLTEMKQEVKQDLKDIKESDLQNLNQRQEALEKVMNLARSRIELVFEQELGDIKHELSMFETETGTISYQYKNIKIATETKQVEEKHAKDGAIPWVKRQLGVGGYETNVRTETTSYANINQAVDQVSEFVLTIEKDLKEKIKQVKDFSKLESKLLNVIFDVLQGAGIINDLSEEEILLPIRKAVNNIQLPEVEFNAHEYEDKIISQFSGRRVTNDNISNLQRLIRRVINDILDDVDKLLDDVSKQIINAMEETSNNFIANVLQESQAKLDKIKGQMEEKEEYINKYETLLEQLETDITHSSQLNI